MLSKAGHEGICALHKDPKHLSTTWLLMHINSIAQHFLGNVASGVNNFVKASSQCCFNSPTDISMIGNPDFHSKQLKIIIKFPLQNFTEKPQGFLLC